MFLHHDRGLLPRYVLLVKEMSQIVGNDGKYDGKNDRNALIDRNRCFTIACCYVMIFSTLVRLLKPSMDRSVRKV